MNEFLSGSTSLSDFTTKLFLSAIPFWLWLGSSFPRQRFLQVSCWWRALSWDPFPWLFLNNVHYEQSSFTGKLSWVNKIWLFIAKLDWAWWPTTISCYVLFSQKIWTHNLPTGIYLARHYLPYDSLWIITFPELVASTLIGQCNHNCSHHLHCL